MSMPSARRRLDLESIGGVTIISFRDDRIVSDEVIEEIGEQLLALVEEQGARRLLLNFGHVKALSSAALGKLLVLRQKLATVKGTLRLCCVHPELLEVFHLHRPKGAPALFEVYPEEQEALEAFGPVAQKPEHRVR
jgi:anti-sigma B factor antagonist